MQKYENNMSKSASVANSAARKAASGNVVDRFVFFCPVCTIIPSCALYTFYIILSIGVCVCEFSARGKNAKIASLGKSNVRLWSLHKRARLCASGG